jgi:hypothetical protein
MLLKHFSLLLALLKKQNMNPITNFTLEKYSLMSVILSFQTKLTEKYKH